MGIEKHTEVIKEPKTQVYKIKSRICPEYHTRDTTSVRSFFDGKLWKMGMDYINDITAEQYIKINEYFNPKYRVEISELSGTPYAVIRTVDGSIKTHIYLTTDYTTIWIYDETDEFLEVGMKLEKSGYFVHYGRRDCYDFKINPF